MKKLHIKLEYNNRIVYQADFEDITDEIIIGRSKTCRWSIDDKKTGMSGQHVSLLPKKGSIILSDMNSTNGVYFKGKRITKRKLALNDKIVFAGCVLYVELSKSTNAKANSELILLSGKEKGKKYQLVPPLFTIGSEPDSSLMFMDMLVSRKHAQISIKDDGSCWILDLGSKNGSSVNNVPLRHKERLLKDCDKIMIAHYELEFHDGAIKKINSQAWTKILIIIITVILVLLGYYAWTRFQTPVDILLNEAKSLAAEGKFSEAEMVLENVYKAPDYEKKSYEVTQLKSNLTLWKSTEQCWYEAQVAMENSNWEKASSKLGNLSASKPVAWQWNQPNSEKQAHYAKNSKKLLDCYLDAENILKGDDYQFKKIVANYVDMTNIFQNIISDYPQGVLNLKSNVYNSVLDTQSLISEFNIYEANLDELKSSKSKSEVFDVIINADSEYRVLQKIQQRLCPVILKLSDSYDKLLSMSELISNMEFQKASKIDVKLPSAGECAVDIRISDVRREIEKKYEIVKQTAATLNVLYNKIGNVDSNYYLETFSLKKLEPVVACDTLKYPLSKVKRSREKPAGAYDRYLGVEEFYGSLDELPDQYNLNDVADISFVPLVREFSTYLDNVKSFLDYVEKNNWVKYGKLSQEVNKLSNMQSEVDSFVDEMIEKAIKSDGREAIIYAGIAYKISDKPKQIDNKPIEKWLGKKVDDGKIKISKANNLYKAASWEDQIKIRDAVLEQWLPGDSTVKTMWAKKKEK